MSDSNQSLPYNDSDEKSILLYAGKLNGHTLKEIASFDIESARTSTHSKGFFGQALEEFYFYIKNNNIAAPDFINVGMELKSTPMKKTKGKGIVSKERLVLSIIDYMTINQLEFEGSFKKKNGKLLIVFYQSNNDVQYYDQKILKVVHWTYPPEDLRIIEEDWNTISKMVTEGRSHELSERFTHYLGACTKGMGHERDYREQPNSDIPARQRALSLKSSYVNKIFRESTQEEYTGVFTSEALIENKVGAFQSVFSNRDWTDDNFESFVLKAFDKFIGMKCSDIEKEIGISLNVASKSYRSQLTLNMMGIKTKKAKEFVDSDIEMKTIFLKPNNTSQESMSFSYFDYIELTKQTWETSDFCEVLDKRFFFPVFQRPKKNGDVVFKGAFFWSMPYLDMCEAKIVWEDTLEKIKMSDIDNLITSKQNRVAHVRPHARNSKDTCMAPNGQYYMKKCFWFNRNYISDIVKNSGILNKNQQSNLTDLY